MTTPRPNSARDRHWLCAQRLRERRLALGLTQREVVSRLQRCGMQTTNRVLSAMENGRGLDLGLLPDLCTSLECTVTYLLGLTTDPQSWRPDRSNRPPDRAPAPASQPASSERPHAYGVLGPVAPAGYAAPTRGQRRGPARESGDVQH